jgi:hypothetical protein
LYFAWLFWLSATVQAQDFQYSIDNGQVTITGYSGSGGEVAIPETIEDLPVTSIGDYAFTYSSLTSAAIPGSVTMIGNQAFSDCASLDSITVDPVNQAFSSLDGVLFDKNRGVLIQFPGGKSGSYTMPDSVVTIGTYAFLDCYNLTDVIIPESVTTLAESAFNGCSGLTGISIPDSVITIGTNAFLYCTGLTNIIIPNSVTTIGESVFWECTGLTNVTLGSGVATIGEAVFVDCNSLAAITVDPGNSAFSSLDGVLFDKGRGVLIQFPLGKNDNYTIPESVITIGTGAFSGCVLSGVTIGNNITSIGDYAFLLCANMTGITVGNSITNIGDSAFYACAGMTNIALPNSVITIGDDAFQECTALMSAIIPASVTSIGKGIFAGCTNLPGIRVDAGNPNYSGLDGVLFNKTRTTLIEYPSGQNGSYSVPASVTSIGENAFDSCVNLTSLIIDDSVSTIGRSAFSYCAGLTSVTFGKNVSSLGDYAFYNCASLASVTIPSGLTNIGDSVFAECASLASVTIPDSVTSIGEFAFGDCKSLTSVGIGIGVVKIGDFGFYGCTNLRSAYFMGDAPELSGEPFKGADRVTGYYRAGRTGWTATFAGRPAVLWMPEDDLDHDGITNMNEFLAGSDPSDAQSALAFEHAIRPDDLTEEDKTPLPPSQFALYFQSIPGKSYEVQFTGKLGSAWSKAGTIAAGRATQKRVVLDRPVVNGFYRLVLAAAQ